MQPDDLYHRTTYVKMGSEISDKTLALEVVRNICPSGSIYLKNIPASAGRI